MDLTLTGELAKHLITMTRKDGKLAEAMAREYLKAVSATEIAAYLLTPDVTLRLLAERLRKNPEQTLRQLQDLAGQQVRRPRGARAGRAKTRGTGKRIRLSQAEVEGLKTKVRSYLGHHPWSNRKQLFGAVTFPSLAVYNRILGELRESGEVRSNGEKSKTVYALRGAKAEKPARAGKVAKRTKAKRGRPAKARGRAKTVRSVKKPAKPAKATKAASKAKATRKRGANARLCPVPGCTNPAAPRFGMLCKEHKDIPAAEREKHFAARRAAKAKAR